ncbi:MAG: ribosome small subunit-dependent GTPase [Verrucomicrobiota bacterium]|jgi:ribosome biogenesis GTPase
MADSNLSLTRLGWNSGWDATFAPHRERGLRAARVAVQDKHHYVLFAEEGELIAQIAGKLLHGLKSDAELPKVGDWVAFKPTMPGEKKAVIQAVLPRRTKLGRKIPGRETEEQLLVTNIDIAFIVLALDETFNPRLLERFLLMVIEGGAKPVVVLNKADLCDDLDAHIAEAQRCAGGAPIVAVSAKTRRAMKQVLEFIQPGAAVVFIGTSGVGKSTLINRLYGDAIQPTTEVRESDSKGRHTTTWRELIVLPNDGLVIDTPGMREFQLWMAGEGIHEAFPDIELLALKCRFRECRHGTEKDCAVQAALQSGALAHDRFNNFLKLRGELEFLGQARLWHQPFGRGRSETEKRKQARREKWRFTGGED